jgi:hypothetical protein
VFVRRTADCVLLLATDGPPLALRGTAVSIWDAFASSRAVDDVARDLATSHGAPIEIVAAEVASLVDQLRDNGMLAPQPGHDE